MAIKYPLKSKKVLITCGPTWVPIDDVRVISNCSTGELGNTLAQILAKEKAAVTVLQGPAIYEQKPARVTVKKFNFYDELLRLLKKELKKKYDIVIHAAAVSDYRLKSPRKEKLKSGRPKVTLTLVPTVKLIEKIKKINPRTLLVGFKLETNIARNNVLASTHKLFNGARCDLVVANSLKNGRYSGFIIGNNKNIIASCNSRKIIARNLVKALKKKIAE